jgi:hypothetical protein
MRIARIAGWILTAALVLAPAAGRAQESGDRLRVGTPGHTAEWNGEEVATLADDLAKAVREVRRESRRTPSPGQQAAQDVAWFHFEDRLRLIRSEARQLARVAREGRSHDEIYPIYQRMWSWVRDAQDTIKRMMVPKELDARIQDAGAILDQLDTYFD